MKFIIPCLALLGILAFVSLSAEPRTFTDQFGRTIVAEIVSADKDSVRIRRADGNVFDLPLAKLSEADQKFVAEWIAANPEAKAAEKPAFDPTKVSVTYSRTKYDSRNMGSSTDFSHKHETWGYSIDLVNAQMANVPKVRLEYNIYANSFYDVSNPVVIAGAQDFTEIKGRAKEIMKTKGATICRWKSMSYGNGGGDFKGIWIKLYVDGKLVSEQASSESVKTISGWTQP